MIPQLRERLQTVQVTPPRTAQGLQVFGLRWEPAAPQRYTTLDEALAGGQLEVTEVNDGGTVPTLKVFNKSDTMTFLMAGEQLSGGKQNRVLNASIMVAGQSELPIPVTCVERGRWAYRSAHFGSSGSASHSKLRRLMHLHATDGYRHEGKPTSKQGEVWEEVDRKLQQTGSMSPTHVLHKAYEDTEARLGEAVSQLPAPEGANGVVFAYDGRIVGFDLFDQPQTLVKLWPKLLRAYAIDALNGPTKDVTPVTAEDVRDWLRSASQAQEEIFKSPGLGEDVRLQGDRLVGAGLVIEECPVHVEVFANS
jgi:hypothetical protein